MSFNLLKVVTFKTFGLKTLELSFNVSNVSVCKTYGCICTIDFLRNSIWNILLKVSKRKQASEITGVVERECIEFMRECPSKDPLVLIHCELLSAIL